jgi:hypothetical protein
MQKKILHIHQIYTQNTFYPNSIYPTKYQEKKNMQTDYIYMNLRSTSRKHELPRLSSENLYI